jgi:hypothetical protein
MKDEIKPQLISRTRLPWFSTLSRRTVTEEEYVKTLQMPKCAPDPTKWSFTYVSMHEVVELMGWPGPCKIFFLSFSK